MITNNNRDMQVGGTNQDEATRQQETRRGEEQVGRDHSMSQGGQSDDKMNSGSQSHNR